VIETKSTLYKVKEQLMRGLAVTAYPESMVQVEGGNAKEEISGEAPSASCGTNSKL